MVFHCCSGFHFLRCDPCTDKSFFETGRIITKLCVFFLIHCCFVKNVNGEGNGVKLSSETRGLKHDVFMCKTFKVMTDQTLQNLFAIKNLFLLT